MSRSLRNYPNYRLTIRLVLLAALSLVAVVYQTRFSWDVIRAVWHPDEVARVPFGFEMPPTVSRVELEADAVQVHDGDKLLAVNGQPFRGIKTLSQAVARLRPGENLTVTILRPDGQGEEAQTVSIRLAQWQQGVGRAGWLLALVLDLLLPGMCLLLGIWVAAVRPTKTLAWLLLVLMLSFTQLLSPHWLSSWGSTLRYPAEIYHRALRLAWPIGMILFGLYFPRRFAFERRYPWVKWVALTPLIIIALSRALVEIGRDENFATVEWLSGSFIAADAIVQVLAVCGAVTFLVSLGWKLLTETNADNRRRLRLLLWGTGVSLTPLFLLAIAARLTGKPTVEGFSPWLVVPSLLMLILFPVTLAYVIVVHYAVDVRVIIRQGIKYALARRGVAVLRIAASGGVAYGTMLEVQRHHAHYLWRVVAVGAGIALLLATRRLGDRLGDWVDRRFFREAYDVEQILSELSDTVRTMVETSPLLETVARRLSESLHVPRIVFLLRSGNALEPAYSVGYPCMPEARFSDSGTTVKHLGRSHEPTRVYLNDPASWIYAAPAMTEEERLQLVSLGTELLLPMSVKDKLIGFMSLGPKQSDEPYSGSDVHLLQSVASQTGLALENSRLTEAIARDRAQRERANRELEIARDVQQRLFPQKLPKIIGLDYFGTCRPALRVGGDYFDFLALRDGKLGVAIGDVSGKGIGAALMMAGLQGSLRGQLLHGNGELTQLMASVNALMYEATEPARYATLFYAEYDPGRCCLSYVNAGHNAPMLFRRFEGRWELQRLEAGGTVVGLLPDILFEQETLQLKLGDLLVAFTDGISEAMNAADEEFGELRLRETIECSDDLSANELAKRVLCAVDEFVGSAQPHDDMTLMVMRLIEAP
jgi:sigma-B regulation protein RsbU (phosphoserine phosphatase)